MEGWVLENTGKKWNSTSGEVLWSQVGERGPLRSSLGVGGGLRRLLPEPPWETVGVAAMLSLAEGRGPCSVAAAHLQL